MEFEHLFTLSDAGRRGALHARLRHGVKDAFAVQRGEEPLPTPAVCDQFLGRTPYDLVGTGFVALYLLSERVTEALQREAFTGWKPHPAEIRTRAGELIPGYHLLIVTGRCGPIDKPGFPRAGSGSPGAHGPAIMTTRGLHFDPNTWDGADIFVPEGAGWIIVVERVRDALKAAKVTNIDLPRVTEVEQVLLLPSSA
jgi:hypothetical protein